MRTLNIPIQIQVGEKAWGESIETNAELNVESLYAALTRNLPNPLDLDPATPWKFIPGQVVTGQSPIEPAISLLVNGEFPIGQVVFVGATGHRLGPSAPSPFGHPPSPANPNPSHHSTSPIPGHAPNTNFNPGAEEFVDARRILANPYEPLFENEEPRVFDRITIDPEVMAGQPCLRGYRYTVAMVLEFIASSMSTEDILEQFPPLEAEDLTQALMYAVSSLRGEPVKLV